jgi:hypothetical protein
MVIERHHPYLVLAAQDSPGLPVGALFELCHRSSNKLLVREQELNFLLTLTPLTLIEILIEPWKVI